MQASPCRFGSVGGEGQGSGISIAPSSSSSFPSSSSPAPGRRPFGAGKNPPVVVSGVKGGMGSACGSIKKGGGRGKGGGGPWCPSCW